jgi:hypothetical protein
MHHDLHETILGRFIYSSDKSIAKVLILFLIFHLKILGPVTKFMQYDDLSYFNLMNLPKLKRRIIKAWNSLNLKILKKTVHQMPLIVNEIINRKGGRVSRFKQHCECRLCVE